MAGHQEGPRKLIFGLSPRGHPGTNRQPSDILHHRHRDGDDKEHAADRSRLGPPDRSTSRRRVALLGIDPAPLPYLGRNLLAAPEDGPLPRPHGDWLDASHLFLARGAASICYDVVRRDVRILADRSRACAAARRMRDLSRLIIVEDLQKPLRERLSSAIP